MAKTTPVKKALRSLTWLLVIVAAITVLNGYGVLFISSELEEVARTAQRVIVLRDHQKIAELTGSQISEAAIMLQTISESGGCMNASSSVHMNIFGLEPVVKFGSDEQKQRFLPPLIQGKDRACFGVTEPNTGVCSPSGHLAERH